MTDSSDLIKPGEIPGKDINIELITLSAKNLRTAATRIRDHGAAAVTDWSALSGSYRAPEAEQLFGVMTPVGTSTTTFGDHLDIATGALEAFAEEITPIKAELDRLRAEAWAFVGDVAGGVDVPVVYATRGGVIDTGKTQEKEWHEVDASIDKNNQLRIDVNTQMELLWAAERRAANTIRALYCAVPLVADDGSGSANVYMYDEIPDDAEVPWGHPVERTEGCGEAAVSFVFEDFLWKGIVVGGIWGTVTGLGGLISYNSQTGQWGDWDFAGQAWKQLGQLAYAITVPPAIQQAAATQDNAFGDWNRESQETVINTLKGVVAWDQWAENPGAAAGTAVFNVGTIFIPAGAAVTSIKSGALASKLATAARVIDYLDASSLVLKAGTGAFRFTSTGLGQLSNVLDGIRFADSVDSQIPSVGGSTISIGDNVVSGADEFLPPVREDVHVDLPVRETVEVGGGSGGGLHGGAGNGLPPSGGLPDGPGGSQLDDAPTGGANDAPNDGSPTPNDGSPDPHDGSANPHDGSADPVDTSPSTDDVVPPRPETSNQVDVSAADAPGSRTPFAARTDLEPNTVYHVEGRGDFYTNATGAVTRVETQYGGNGSLNADLMKPQPNTTYVVHPSVTGGASGPEYAHLFHTDELGRTDLAYTEHLSDGDADRSQSVQSRTGHEGGEGYVGGHLLGNGFGGGGEYVNMAAMLREVNGGSGDSFFNLENQWRSMLQEVPPPRIEVSIHSVFSGTSTVPDMFVVNYHVNGVEYWQEFGNG